MFGNYLKLAWRSLRRDKVGSAIEVFGLSIGLACCLLMLLFVRHEWSYDQFHSRHDDIYRAWVKENYDGGRQIFNSITPLILGQTLDETYPEVEKVVRINVFTDLVQRGETSNMSRIHLVDPTFFEVFDFAVIAGDRTDALVDPNSIVLSKEVAERHFGTPNPIGQTLSIRLAGEFEDFRVAAVTENPPTNSSISYEYLISFEQARKTYPEGMFTSWFNIIAETYVLLDPRTDSEALAAKFPGMLKTALGDRYEESGYTVGLQPLTDIHLDTSIPAGIAPVSDPAYTWILGTIAILILLIACINYMTLSIGRSSRRAVEVGIRKSIGAERTSIIRQFWGEALLSVVLALAAGLVLAEAFRPLFNSLGGTDLELVFDGMTIGSIIVLGIVVALVAGSYPAIVLSRFHPVEILKGKARSDGDRSLVRRGLVVIQFSLSVFLIIATLAVGRQLDFLESKPLGFDKDHVVVVPTTITPTAGKRLPEVIAEGMELGRLFRSEIALVPGVSGMTAAGHRFGEPWTTIGYDADDGGYYSFFMNVVDEDYLGVMGIELASGRWFSRDNPSDPNRSVVVNEAFVKAHGFNEGVGSRLHSSSFVDHEIIGVVKDFNFESLHGAVRPLVLVLDANLIFSGANDVSIEAYPVPKMMVRVDGADLNATMEQVEAAWMKVAPDQEYSYSFVDEAIGAQYRSERRLGQLVRISSILAIVIACLGLFGLSGLAAARRTKEIGIRKVLGASVPRLYWMLSREFGLLALVSCAIAAPVAYLVLKDWLSDFAYRASLSADLFILSAVAVVAVALFAVSYQAWRACRSNPVESLRYE